jgi:hypothetical protein
MKTLFVPHELTLELKELGFDEPYWFGYYLCRNSATGVRLEITTNWIDLTPYDSVSCKAPTFYQAFKWFDENTFLRGFVTPSAMIGHFDWCIVIEEKKNSNEIQIFSTEFYVERNEAELACLKKLIEIQKTK